MNAGTLLVRTDASVTIGTGHVMRCLAFAQAWQDAGGRVLFAAAEIAAAILARLQSESVAVVPISSAAGTSEDVRETMALARREGATWIVADGYQFGADYQRALKVDAFKLLFVDDYGHATPYSADFVLNQNAGASPALYEDREPQTRLLLGPEYCLLRREFAAWRHWQREVLPVARRVLVLMGSSDPGNLTARVIEALRLAGGELKATIVVGGSNPHLSMLEGAAERTGMNVTLIRDVIDIGKLMAEADVAVSAAGSTCWELCLLGLPALIVDVAANQRGVAEELDRRGCAIHIGDHMLSAERVARELNRLCESHDLRQSMSRRCRELVDGKGASRVVSAILCGETVRLRPVTSGDRRLLWEWANDPMVRQVSFSPEPISWETHTAWFDAKLGNGASQMWIAEDPEANPVGQIRFDVRPDGGWEVDVSVAEAIRGRGLGAEIIRLGMNQVNKQRITARVHAYVKPANRASVKAFLQCGFRETGTEDVRGQTAIHFVYEKN